ncbi:amidase family protein, partial [Litorisediminicola beolgyonensis]
VRAPASFCGTWGLRPTWGRAPLAGCMPLVPSFDTCGLFARDGTALLAAAGVLMGPDSAALGSALWQAGDMLPELTPTARAALTPLMDRLAPDTGALYVADPAEMHDCFDMLQSREVVATHGAWIAERQPPLGPYIADRYARALAVDAETEAQWRARRVEMAEDLSVRLAPGPALAPVVHDAPIRADAGVAAQLAFGAQARRLLCVAGVGGLPQVVFPALTLEGAPLGLSLIGPPGSDLALIARAMELVEALTS